VLEGFTVSLKKDEKKKAKRGGHSSQKSRGSASCKEGKGALEDVEGHLSFDRSRRST